MNNLILTIAVAGVVGFGAGASASMTPSTTVTLDADSNVSVSFVSQSAGWTGSLYLSGYEREGTVFDITSTDDNDAGMYLFDNHGTEGGFTVNVGAFLAGDTLHFDYIVWKGNKANNNIRYVIESDAASELVQFGAGAPTEAGGAIVTRLGVEDIIGSGSDWDYNDLVFDVTATAVPAPGATGLALIGTGLLIRRRRA